MSKNAAFQNPSGPRIGVRGDGVWSWTPDRGLSRTSLRDPGCRALERTRVHLISGTYLPGTVKPLRLLYNRWRPLTNINDGCDAGS